MTQCRGSTLSPFGECDDIGISSSEMAPMADEEPSKYVMGPGRRTFWRRGSIEPTYFEIDDAQFHVLTASKMR